MQTQTIIGRDFPKIVIPLINNAKKSIDILVYDWRWYADQIGSSIQKFSTAIIYATKRGIKVRAITRTKNTVIILKENGVIAKEWTGGNIMHTKLMLIDDRIAIIGSHNYTVNAFSLNLEVSTLTMDENGLPEIKSYFENVWLL